MTAKQQFLLLGVLPAGSGLLLMVAGFNFRMPVLYTLGLLALSFAALATGIASCLYRRIVFINPNRRRFDLIVWQGVAAIPFGGTYIVGGFLLLAVAIAHLTGMSADAMRDAIIARPGLLLALLGVATLSYSIGFAIGFPAGEDAKRGATWNALMSIPARLGALILFVIGGTLLGIGGWELLHTAEFDRWIKVLLHGGGFR